eukprot:CAMPEP_0119324316 /NCGR_PEP_ID=MMETSP1333-20130426/62822_1 /TAXON_ID=418940 /ORGANISM="Scyphosphaera apsteinii, Strain RCC1455" /LENGTH=145 /DNA_ID=CAMNT_0007331995 /DNA_START=147 /DNA_END=584 /DNA_ORIENTATION=-
MDQIKSALKTSPESLNVQGPGGQSPLMHAVLSGKVRAVKFLLKKGADPKVPEKDGYTPMHGAGFQGRAEIARLLIGHGLDPFDVHKDGHSPMQRACWGNEQRHTDTVRVFLEAGATESDMHKCLQRTSPATKKLVLEMQAAKEEV